MRTRPSANDRQQTIPPMGLVGRRRPQLPAQPPSTQLQAETPDASRGVGQFFCLPESGLLNWMVAAPCAIPIGRVVETQYVPETRRVAQGPDRTAAMRSPPPGPPHR